MDAVLLAAAAAEIRRRGVGARIERVSQPAAAMLVLHLWGADPKARQLLVSAEPALPRVQLTWCRRENPPTPPPFCLLLRRHLEGGRLAAVEQPGIERVLYLRFQVSDQLGDARLRTLAVHLLGPRSEVALLDGDGRVLGSLRQRAAVGEGFPPPPLQEGKVDPLAGGAAIAAALRRGDPARVVAGISPRLSAALLAAAGSDPEGLASGLEATLGAALAGRLSPPVREAWGLPAGPEDAVSLACDAAFGLREDQARLTAGRARLQAVVQAHLQRAARKLDRQEAERALAAGADALRRQGELLLCHLGDIPRGARQVTLPDLEEPDVSVTIALDPRQRPADNAQAIFRRYRKAQRAQEHLARQVEATQQEVAYLADAERAVHQAENAEDLAGIESELAAEGYLRVAPGSRGRRRPDVRSKPLDLDGGGGWRVLVGKNARQNDWLTMKQARPVDIWLHAKGIPGSHVLVCGPQPGTEPTADLLRRAAEVAAYYSAARQSSRVPVDYTLRRHVWKPRGARPGFVLYDHERTLAVDPRLSLTTRAAGEPQPPQPPDAG